MKTTATILALITICIWSFLSFFGSRLNSVPPFLLVGIALCTGSLVSIVRFSQWRVPWRTFLIGIAGLFGYHFLFFTAFRYAPAIEASLMNYFWPLLIVVLSPLFLKGYSLHLNHILGVLLGLSGAALIVTGGKFSLDIGHLFGYILAAGAALVWASYSLLTKRVPPFPTVAVGGFCLASALLSLGLYSLEVIGTRSFYRPSLQEWILLILLGLGPMGSAFFTWDAALKRGDPRIIGSLAYLTPMLSTLNLIVFGGKVLTWVSGLAMLLIVSGALLGSLSLFRINPRMKEAPL